MSKLLVSTFVSLSILSVGCGSDGGTAADGSAPSDSATVADGAAGDSVVTADGASPGDGGVSDGAMVTSDAGPSADVAPMPGDAGGDVNLMAGFVRATVEGKVLDYGALVGAQQLVAAGGPYLSIGGHMALNGQDYWAINVPNVVGTYNCGDTMHPFTSVGLSRSEGGLIPVMYSSSSTGGGCTITLTATATNAGDVAKGTFSAKLISLYKNSQTQMLTVTDGAFEAGLLK